MAAPMKYTSAKSHPILLMLFCIIFPTFSCDNIILNIQPRDILTEIQNSCVLVGNTNANYELLVKVGEIFSEDPVTVASADLSAFKWPSDEDLEFVLRIDSDQEVVLALFTREVIDRTCLILPPASSQIKPKAIPLSGITNIDTVVEFVNSHCNTYRKSDGSLSVAGLHRLDILENLYQLNENSVTMDALYDSPQNPFKKASHCIATSHKVENHSCLPYSAYEKSKYAEPNKDLLEIPQCDRIKLPLSTSDFFHTYLKRSRPMIIEGAAKDWVAFKKWTNEFFMDNFGNNRVHIKLTPGGDFEGVERAELWDNYKTFQIPQQVREKLPYPDLVVVRPAGINMNFSEFLDLITWAAEQPTRNVSAYLEYSSIPEHMPELENDITEFDFAKKILKRKHLNIWLSDGNTIGRLHFDQFDNFLCQLRGQKQVLLFDPYDNTHMYEGHIPQAMLAYDPQSKKFHRRTLQDSTSMVMSPVDLLNPDRKRFPLFGKMKPLNCTIDEGDVLYMPSYWWHEVYSAPNLSEKRNLAVNYWYEPFLTREFPCPECKLDVNPLYRHLL